jgi:hypothetical protein
MVENQGGVDGAVTAFQVPEVDIQRQQSVPVPGAPGVVALDRGDA